MTLDNLLHPVSKGRIFITGEGLKFISLVKEIKMITVESVWDNKPTRVIDLTKEEFTYELLRREYQDLCRGSFEPTDLLVSSYGYTFLQKHLFSQIPQFTNRLWNMEISETAAVNRIIMTWEEEKLTHDMLRHKNERETKIGYSVVIFTISNMPME